MKISLNKLFMLLIFFAFYSTAQADYDRGVRQLEKANYRLALDAFRKVRDETDQARLAPLYGKALLKVANIERYRQQLFRNKSANRNFAADVAWFRKAVMANIASAQYVLGVLYRTGSIVGKDKDQAMALLTRAAERNEPEAQYTLGQTYMLYQESQDKAITWLEKAVANNHLDAMADLAVLYLNSKDDYKNYTRAFNLVYKAATRGNDKAQNMIWAFYRKGIGVEKDLIKAYAWCTNSADRGDRNARQQLGDIKKELGVIDAGKAMLLAREYRKDYYTPYELQRKNELAFELRERKRIEQEYQNDIQRSDRRLYNKSTNKNTTKAGQMGITGFVGKKRGEKQIQQVFSRREVKNAIYRAYRKLLRKNRELQGTIVFSLTIAPSGEVTKCRPTKISKSFQSLGRSVCQVLEKVSFGKVSGKKPLLLRYPIQFQP